MPMEEVGSDTHQGVWGPQLGTSQTLLGSVTQWLPGSDPALGGYRGGAPEPRARESNLAPLPEAHRVLGHVHHVLVATGAECGSGKKFENWHLEKQFFFLNRLVDFRTLSDVRVS